jgi:multiple sugar transport system permease protein
MKKRKMKNNENKFITLILLLGGFLMFTPLVWMLLTSFKPESEVLKLPLTFFPENFILDTILNCFQN